MSIYDNLEPVSTLSYCPKCGSQGLIFFRNGLFEDHFCPYCGTQELPTKYNANNVSKGIYNGEKVKDLIYNEYIKGNPLYDENAVQQRLDEVKKEKEEYTIRKMRQQQVNTPTCPTCHSTNVSKISGAKKAAGFLTVGVFSSNFGKTMECKNCGYKW